MARISGVDLPREKRVDIGLTYVYGVGRASALSILTKAGIDGAIRVKDLSEEHIVKIREIIQEGHQVEGDLRKTFSMNIKRLIDSGTYRGLRHRKGLPVRGQRTKTNAPLRCGKQAKASSAFVITYSRHLSREPYEH
jgi:small subunit ribosomal protein S13